MLIPFCPLGWGKVFIRNKNTFTGEVQFSLVVCRDGKSEVIRNMRMLFTKRQQGCLGLGAKVGGVPHLFDLLDPPFLVCHLFHPEKESEFQGYLKSCLLDL